MKFTFFWPSGLKIFAIAVVVVLAVQITATLQAQSAEGTDGAQINQSATGIELRLRPIRTDSPRQTLATYLRLRAELETSIVVYRLNKSRKMANHLDVLLDQFISLIDLSTVPRSSQRNIGLATTAHLLDIFGRTEVPSLDGVPGEESLSNDNAVENWRITGTPLRISRISEGAREDEYLFNSRSVVAAPRYSQAIGSSPLKSKFDIESWSQFLPQLTGPIIPATILTAVPRSLLATWFDTPIWKVLLLTLVFLLAIWLVVGVYKITGQCKSTGKLQYLSNFAAPVAALIILLVLNHFADRQLYVTGRFSTLVDFVIIVGLCLSLSWVFWFLMTVAFEWIITAPGISQQSLDANLLRLAGQLVGVIGVVMIFAYGAHDLGIPAFSVLAGLGIGGIAVALAVRPTLENLIGGLFLFVDKPIQVGDRCAIGSLVGSIHEIGVRSTRVRGPDRSITSIPNGKLVNMEITNLSRRDKFLIERTINLPGQTAPDQLHNVLTSLRDNLQAHPKIDPDTVRIHLVGASGSSLDISIRIYAQTRQLDEFFAVREDVLFNIQDIIAKAS